MWHFAKGKRQDARDPAVKAAFLRAERDGLRLVVLVRTVALVLIAAWLIWQFPRREVLWTVGLIGIFTGLGLLQWWLIHRNPERRWFLFVFVPIDVLVVTAAVLFPNPLLEIAPPLPLLLRLGSFAYFFLLVALTGLLTSPALTLWTGICVALVWLGATEMIAQMPGAFRLSDLPSPPEFGSPRAFEAYTRLEFVDVVQGRQNAVLILIVAGIVSTIVARARSFVVRQAAISAERAALARYFSPNLLDEISRNKGSLTEARAVEAAVLFTDIRGFSSLAERLNPNETVALLREVHQRIAEAVFRYDGTLDKFTGDGAMALFGAPNPSADDAARALRAARDLLDALETWNRGRREAGKDEVRVGVGLHWGRVVTGNVGDARRLDFTAIGDTVNLASRLERLTRELDTDLVASEMLCARAQTAGAVLDGLVDAGTQPIRGREEPLGIRMLARPGQCS